MIAVLFQQVVKHIQRLHKSAGAVRQNSHTSTTSPVRIRSSLVRSCFIDSTIDHIRTVVSRRRITALTSDDSKSKCYHVLGLPTCHGKHATSSVTVS